MLSDCGTAWILPWLPQAAVTGNSRNCYCCMHCCDCHQRSRPLTHFQPSLASLKHTTCMAYALRLMSPAVGRGERGWSHTRADTPCVLPMGVDRKSKSRRSVVALGAGTTQPCIWVWPDS